MARSTWAGAITFARFPISVKAYNLHASPSKDSFKTLCTCHGEPIKAPKTCATTGAVLDASEQQKGIQQAKGVYFALSADAVAAIEGANRSIVLEPELVVSVDSLPLHMVTGSYRFVPESDAFAKAVATMHAALTNSRRALVTRWTSRTGGRDAILAIHGHDGELLGNTLPFVRQLSDAPAGATRRTGPSRPPTVDPHLPLTTGPPMMDVTSSSALRVADAYACVRALADAVASLSLHAYRRTPAGREPAGEDSRIVRLLTRPAPGSTLPDLLSLIMVHLNVHGEAFVGKYRSSGEVVQLGLIDPTAVDVELRGQRIVYRLLEPGIQHGPADVLHIKEMTDAAGLRGLSPVAACRLALQLSSSLQTSATSLSGSSTRSKRG